MDTSSPFLAALLRETLRDPRAAARRLLSLDLPRAARWEALALVVAVSALVGQFSILLTTGSLSAPGLLGSPVQSAAVQGAVLVVMVTLAHQVGRALGGTGSFDGALIVIAWLQGVMIAVQIVQIAALVVLPPLAGLIGVAGLVIFGWLLTNFIAELHGFVSLGRVFATILAAAFGFAFVLAIFMAVLGIEPPGAM